MSRPAADNSNGVVTYAVRVSFPDTDPKVKVGMTADLSIDDRPQGQRPAGAQLGLAAQGRGPRRPGAGHALDAQGQPGHTARWTCRPA